MKSLPILAGGGLVAAVFVVYWLSGNGPASVPGGVVIRTAPELSSTRDALSTGAGQVQWYSPSLAPGTWPNGSAGKVKTQEAVRAAAERLAQVDYTSLSLPAFTAETAGLAVRRQDFSGAEPWLDSRGVSPRGKWEMYGWRGPEFPEKADRPLVHRWVQIYALYDVDTHKILRLLATIAGEAQE